tara:strand:+ start:152 stop:496 length:345 start_codon:yes stop_codon:yes gene_type:complete
MLVDNGVMRSVNVKSPREQMTDIQCRKLYNDIIANMKSKNFKMTDKDKKMLTKLRECELYLKELSYYSDLIYQRQVKDGNNENDILLHEQHQEQHQDTPVDYSFNIEETIDGGE